MPVLIRSSPRVERSKELSSLTLGQGVDMAEYDVILRQIWIAAEPALPAMLFGDQLDISILVCYYRYLVEQEDEVTFAMPSSFC